MDTTTLIICALHILGYDIWFYISHILLHSKYFWKYHEIHHRIIYPKYTDTYKGHFLEGPFQSIGFLLPLCFYKFNWIAFLISGILVNIRGMARHDYRTVWLIGDHHLLHHRYFNCNYGEYWIDRLFGTARQKNDVS
jgi:lathosterol oxidase